MFVLHERLENDTEFVIDWPLSTVRLMNCVTYPWLILVPRVNGIAELHHLDDTDQGQAMIEISAASRFIERVHSPDKINVGALGNLVPQLHIHVLGRFKSDPAWPGPVWGTSPLPPFEAGELAGTLDILQRDFSQVFD
jgi:diadenosine tetraphosphate (Ap4A) HIT family hydrolase